MGMCGFGGFPWVSLGFLGLSRFFEVPKDNLGHFGYIWENLGSHGYMWVWWVPLSFFGFSWVL